METKRVAIVFDKNNPRAVLRSMELRGYLIERGVRFISGSDAKHLEDDLILVFGGDGAMLETVHSHNFNGVFMGFNYGHRGSLMNDEDDLLKKIKDESFEIHQFPLLEVETDSGWKGLALEVYFNRIGPKTCKTQVIVNSALISKRLASDGIDITTALASGGYYVNLGGSAVHPKLPVICFSPIARNTPFQIMPMVFPDSHIFEITLLSPAAEAKGWCDGAVELPVFQKLTVKKAAKTFKLAFWNGEDFNKRLVEKIMKVQEVA